MTTPAISRNQIAETLSKIQALSDLTNVPHVTKAKPSSAFDQIMGVARQSLDAINSANTNAEGLKDAYLKGDTSVSLPQVLVSSIQSKIAFEGLLVVRNKLIDAYKEIMNMPL